MNYPPQPFSSFDAYSGGSQISNSGGNQISNAQPDILSMLWRWKWLPILGALLGSIVGLLVWIQRPPQYLAVARVQVVSPSSNTALPMLALDGGEGMNGRADDIAIMQSQVVLRNAIEIKRLMSNPKLSDKGMEELIGWIRNKDRLSVRPGTKEVNTNIIDVHFRCDDAELAAEIVAGIIHGYEKFISKETSAQSQDIVATLKKYSDDYDNRYKVATQNYLKLQKESPFIGFGSEMKDPYTEALIHINEQLMASRQSSQRIFNILDTIEKSAGEEVESLISMVSRAIKDPNLLNRIDPVASMMNEQRFIETTSSTANLREKLLAAKAELEVQKETFGNLHPHVVKLQKNVDAIEASINELDARDAAIREEKLNKLKGVSAAAISPADRLRFMVLSLQHEGAVLLREQEVLQESAQQNAIESKKMGDALTVLKVAQDDMNTIRESAEDLKAALERLTIGAGYGGKIMKPLEIPSTGAPNGPFLHNYLLISSFIGACLFTGLAYLLELADRSYRGPDEIARDLGVPILGHLQMTTLTRKDRKDEKVDLSLVAFHKSKSTAAEAYRGVRTAIYFGNQAGNIKVIQVTSPVPGDGKSTVASNLAISVAQSGRKTLLFDCDMRRPRQAKLLGVRDDIGLTNVLAGKQTLDEAIQTTAVPNMDVLTCGRRPGNPAELLLSDDFVDVVTGLRERYDYIIMDTPPILAVSDPANASACSDGVILTLRLRRNLRPLAIRAAQMLQAVNANLLGVAINGVTGRAGYGYGGYRYDGARANMGYGGYGGYGYGATYGYGDYYTSSSAESVGGRSARAQANGRASANGNGIAHGNGTANGKVHGEVADESDQPSDDSAQN
jgi:capsular exopolysaccharide synthesis family protein